MGYIIKSSKNRPVNISRLDILIAPNEEYFVEDEIFDFPDMEICRTKNILLAAKIDKCPGLPIIDISSTKSERDAKILAEDERVKNFLEERKQQDEFDTYIKKYTPSGTAHGTGFSSDVTVKCKLGYGILIFDGDMPSKNVDEDSLDAEFHHDYLDKEAYAKEFREYAKTQGVFVTEWREEDCKQIWFVDGKHYAETDHHDEFKNKFFDVDHSAVTAVYEKFSSICKEKHGVELPSMKPSWTMHLYHD